MVVGTTQTFNFELQIIDKIGGNRHFGVLP